MLCCSDPSILTPVDSNTLWSGILDERKFGKGRNAASKVEDNLECVGRLIQDKSWVNS